jgi:RecB family exonuclease
MKQKIEEFKNNIHYLEEMFQNSEWEPFKVEEPFCFKFKGVTFKGFIDRIDRHKETGAFRVVDYKTKDVPFNDKDLTTPLQFVVYAMAIKEKYGEFPESFVYELPLVNISQNGGTKGFIARGEKKMTSILESISQEEYKPSPSPLCYYCPYCAQNPCATMPHNKLCKYYSLWTPTNKTFEVNAKYGSLFVLKP